MEDDAQNDNLITKESAPSESEGQVPVLESKPEQTSAQEPEIISESKPEEIASSQAPSVSAEATADMRNDEVVMPVKDF